MMYCNPVGCAAKIRSKTRSRSPKSRWARAASSSSHFGRSIAVKPGAHSHSSGTRLTLIASTCRSCRLCAAARSGAGDQNKTAARNFARDSRSGPPCHFQTERFEGASLPDRNFRSFVKKRNRVQAIPGPKYGRLEIVSARTTRAARPTITFPLKSSYRPVYLSQITARCRCLNQHLVGCEVNGTLIAHGFSWKSHYQEAL